MESPIDLYDDIIKNEEIEPLVIENINKQIYSEITNNGEGINISVSAQNSPIIRGGGLPYPEYVVFQIMFRWDSEHTINKEKFAMEVQTITIAKECRNFENALVKGGVAIFSTLYTLSGSENEGLNELLPIIPFISDEVNRLVPFDVMRLSHFFPENFNDYYRYSGSLTFPPFTSGVIWTIFKEKQSVTRPQMGLLCDIQDEEGNLIVSNNSASRNVKTVLYTSGKIRKKCPCPPGKRKLMLKQEIYDVEQVLKSQIYDTAEDGIGNNGKTRKKRGTTDSEQENTKKNGEQKKSNIKDKPDFQEISEENSRKAKKSEINELDGEEKESVNSNPNEMNKSTQTDFDWDPVKGRPQKENNKNTVTQKINQKELADERQEKNELKQISVPQEKIDKNAKGNEEKTHSSNLTNTDNTIEQQPRKGGTIQEKEEKSVKNIPREKTASSQIRSLDLGSNHTDRLHSKLSANVSFKMSPN